MVVLGHKQCRNGSAGLRAVWSGSAGLRFAGAAPGGSGADAPGGFGADEGNRNFEDYFRFRFRFSISKVRIYLKLCSLQFCLKSKSKIEIEIENRNRKCNFRRPQTAYSTTVEFKLFFQGRNFRRGLATSLTLCPPSLSAPSVFVIKHGFGASGLEVQW